MVKHHGGLLPLEAHDAAMHDDGQVSAYHPKTEGMSESPSSL